MAGGPPNERKHIIRAGQRGTQAGGRKLVAPDSPHRPAGERDSRDDPMIPPDPGARPGVNRALTPGRRRRVTENDQYAAFARRVLRAWARRVAAGDIDAIADMTAAVGELEDAMRQAVAGLRGKGYSWAEIAARLGVTRQAAQQRWSGSSRDLPDAHRPAGCLPDGGHGTPPRRARNRPGTPSAPPGVRSRLTAGVPR
jgi:hypothetical protein